MLRYDSFLNNKYTILLINLDYKLKNRIPEYFFAISIINVRIKKNYAHICSSVSCTTLRISMVFIENETQYNVKERIKNTII